jgi:hypothetical protein
MGQCFAKQQIPINPLSPVPQPRITQVVPKRHLQRTRSKIILEMATLFKP